MFLRFGDGRWQILTAGDGLLSCIECKPCASVQPDRIGKHIDPGIVEPPGESQNDVVWVVSTLDGCMGALMRYEVESRWGQIRSPRSCKTGRAGSSHLRTDGYLER